MLCTSAAALAAVLIAVMPTQYSSTISAVTVLLIMILYVYKIVNILYEMIKKRCADIDGILILLATAVIFTAALIEYWFIRSVPFFTRSGIVSAAFLMFVLIMETLSDIHVKETQKKLIKEQERSLYFEKQNDMTRELVSSVSHDIRTPLAVISGYSQTVLNRLRKNGSGPDAKTEDELLFIMKEAHRLGNLADHLTETNIRKAVSDTLEPCDLLECLDEIQRLADSLLPKNDNSLSVRSPEELPPIYGNVDLISQIFYNLISNANRYTSGDTLLLTADADAEGQKVTLVLTDHGSGMSKEQLSHVFERGYTRGGGHGIGLPICREIISLMGGEITIESEEGKGTAVTVILPVWKEKTT